jgi:hypothetical protein
MDEEELVRVSPRHVVRLASEYALWVRKAPSKDFVVRTIMSREANGLPLVSADIVIAGAETRARFELAKEFPLHFRKTYYPGRLHGDPKHEFDRQTEASASIGIPPPIGYGPDVFRSCLLPGTPYNRLSPFGGEPDENNLVKARKLPLASAAGLFHLLSSAFDSLHRLHLDGLRHGDAELHNLIVCPSPLELLLIDFEAAETRAMVGDAAWPQRCADDFTPLLKEAVYLQCSLGPQPGPLADMARQRLDRLFKNPDRFRQEISDQASPSA